MTKITTGLVSASLTALALGALAPATATAAPSTTPPAPVGSTVTPTDAPRVQATTTPHVSQVRSHGQSEIAVNGVAPGATYVTVDVEGGKGGGLTHVALDRFSFVTGVEHLGKKAVVTAYGPQGPSEGLEIVLDLGDDEGASVPPNTPVVHAVSAYDDEHLVIEGTVTYDPSLFSRTEVHASVRGVPVYDVPDANGSFSLRVPVSQAGQTVDVQAFRDGLASEVVPVELVETEANTASDVFPLGVDSPTTGSVVTTPEATFAGSGIPNSTIVVTHDEKTSRASSTLCETRVASSGDWSCTSPTLPAGSYDTTISEAPPWASAPKQEREAAFAIAEAVEVDERFTPTLPAVSSITELGDGRLIVRVISHNAGMVAMRIDEDRVVPVRGMHGRFVFTMDVADLGKTVSLTGMAGSTQGPSLDVTLTPIEEAAPSPLAPPRLHAVHENGAGDLYLLGTTSYFQDEFDVPQVIIQKDGVFIGGSQATWNGAFLIGLDSARAGEELDVRTVRNGEVSEATTVTLAPTADNDAPDLFPLDVTSPAADAVIPVATEAFTGQGIPGSTIAVSTTTGDATRAGTPEAYTTVLGDGTWTLELSGPLAEGAHTMTVTETPYWDSLAPITSTRSFTVTETGGETPAPVAPVAVTNPADPTTGYTRDQAFTFEGTGRPGSTITIENKFGTHLGTTTVTTAGTWSWTRANMGTSTWHLHFIQDKGQTGSTTASILGFAPRA